MDEALAARSKVRAAALSVASNAALITLKVIAGIATGSVSMLTEAAHYTAHELTRAISRQLPGTDVLVHVEPADRVQPGTEVF